MVKMQHIQAFTFALGLVVGILMLLVGVLFSLTSLLTSEGDYTQSQLDNAYSDRNVCEFTKGCNVSAAEARINELKELKAERKALHYNQAWKAAVVALCGAGILWGLVYKPREG